MNFPACVLIVIGFQRLFHRFLAASCQTSAFARNGALSLLSIFHCKTTFTGPPVKMVWFVVPMVALWDLLTFAGTAVISTIFTIWITALYTVPTPIFACFAFDNDFKLRPFDPGF
ncbi:hypothetical protein EDD16DRAFT_717888 [Pisolithus croceorrhizus]|nr:hypothetical protein EDD16DRAFT_717888 [Pisolithus croceorrhizus]KAI6143526.1 hypothetical protein EDD17DRAFT_208059 [Pisolithus thermaeus]